MADSERQTTFVVKTKHQQAVAGMQAVGGSLQSLGLRATEAQRKLTQITAFEELSAQAKSAGYSWKEAADHVDRLAAELKKTEAPSKAQVREFEKAETTAKKLYAGYRKQISAMSGLRGQLVSAGIDTKNLSAEQARLSVRFEAARKEAVAATKIDLARGLLDVKKPRDTAREIARLEAAYKRLQTAAKSGAVSDRELAAAKKNLKTKIVELTGETRKYTSANKLSLAQLGKFGSYAGMFYTAIRAAKAMVSATIDAETSTYLLESAVAAANRQFDVGSVDDWRGRIARLGDQLRIYSTTELEAATAKTIEMTKRLGLSTEQMEEVIRVSADLSAGKTDLAGGIERVTAALRGEAESAEYLGLTLNEDYVKAQYAAANATGKAWKSLTDLEKAQARYQVLLDQATGTEGRAAGSIDTLAGAWKYMQAQMTDAIRENEDLQEAIRDAADAIAEHADDVLAVVTRLAEWTGKIVQFGVEYGAFAAGLLGSLATLKAVAGGVNGITTAIKLMGGVKVPEIIGSGGAINAALVARVGLYGALAATVWKTYSAYQDMRSAQDEAAAAAQRLAESEAYVRGIVQYANETTGLQIENIAELNRLLRESVIVRNELTGEYRTLAQAEEEQAERTERQLEREKRRQESFERLVEHNRKFAEQYGELDIAAINAADKQRVLEQAMADTEPTAANLRKEMNKAADAYYDAATALEFMAEKESGYADAQKDMLKARKAYVDSVKRLNDQLWRDAARSFSEEEQALKNSFESRKIQLDRWLQNGIISRRDYAYRITRLEEEMQAAILKIKERASASAKKILGEETEEFKRQKQEQIEAELELERVRLEKLEALDEMSEKRKRRRRDEGSAFDGDREDAQRSSGRRAAPDRRGSSTSGSGIAGGFYGQWDSITRMFEEFSSVKELQAWGMKNRNLLYSAGQLTGNPFSNALNKHATDLYRQRMSELAREAGAQTRAENEKYYSAARQANQKQVTLKFQAPDGQAVSGVFDESDVGKVVDVLRNSGMRTA